MADIVKKDVFATQSTGLSLSKGKLKSFGGTPFQQRVNQARASTPDAASMPNRLGLMLDRSSSMHGEKLQLLKDAIDNFVSRCDFTNTSIAVETFPESHGLPLSSVGVLITASVSTITASGNTPMRSCVAGCLEKIPMTRGIIVSDGEATDWRDYEEPCIDIHGEMHQDAKQLSKSILDKYKEAQIPIDCVHIGDSTSGEELLRRIAKETGGIYLKFTDVSAFSKGFSYLTPGYRAQLTDGSVSASDLGANEVRR